MIQFLPLFGRGCVSCLEYYTIMYMMLTVAQMMLDAALFQVLLGAQSLPDTPIDIYQCIIIPVHCLQATLQFFFGFDLYKGVIRRSYRRARNWRIVFLCFLAVEFAIFVAYLALASVFSVFTYVTAIVLIFKAYLIWPLKLFMEECKDSCVPLAQTSSPLELSGGNNYISAAFAARPGPSTSAAAKLSNLY